MRRSWSGLALATLGGCLVYRGLRRAADGAGAPTPQFPHVPPPRTEEPLSREAPAAERDDQPPARTPPASPDEALRSEPDLQTAVPPLEDGPLTAQEQGEAEVIAYFHALERGGGQLPPYDPWRAVEDFCRAAGEVMRRRPGRSVRVNPARPLTTLADPVLAACAC